MNDTNITADAARFIENVAYKDIPAEGLRIGKRCMVDTLGLYLAEFLVGYFLSVFDLCQSVA